MINEIIALEKKFLDNSDNDQQIQIANEIIDLALKNQAYPYASKYSIKLLELDIKNLSQIKHSQLLTNIGIYFAYQGMFVKAKEYMEKAKVLCEDDKKSIAYINIMINLSNVEASLANVQKAIENSLSLVQIIQELKDDNLLCRIYHNIGGYFAKINDYKSSLEYVKRSLKLRFKFDDKKNIGLTMNSISNDYQQLGDNALAMAYMKRALKYIEPTNDRYMLSMIYRNLASLYRKKEQNIQAYEFYTKSLEYCKIIGYNQGIMQNLQEIAVIHSINQEFDKADCFYTEALDFTAKIEDEELINRLFLDYAAHCHRSENYYTSAEYYKKAYFLKEKLYSKNLTNEIARLKTDFELEQNKRESDLLKHKNEALIFSYQEMELQKQELIETNKSKDSILNIVSHDLTNVLSGIKSAIQYLNQQDSIQESKKIIHLINETCDQALNLVRSIIETSKIQMPDFKLNLSLVDINELLNLYLDPIKNYAKHKSIQINFKELETPVKVLVNHEKFWQILLNLLTNAIKFSYQGSQISISLYRDNEFVQVSIKDEGIGIREDKLPLIFDTFTKASRKGTEGENSTGLGLSIVKRLIELHNGKIEVISEENKGSNFIISLPIQQA